MVICLERGADLHMAQLMPLPLASVKSRLVLPFWYRLTWVVPDKGPLNVCVCVCVAIFTAKNRHADGFTAENVQLAMSGLLMMSKLLLYVADHLQPQHFISRHTPQTPTQLTRQFTAVSAPATSTETFTMC